MSEHESIPRAITSIILTYTVVVLACFIWLGIFLKMQGYGMNHPTEFGWTWSAVFLREWGLVFILLLVPWTCYALASYRIDHGWLSANLAIVVGVLMTLFVSLWFIATIFDPVKSRPMLRAVERDSKPVLSGSAESRPNR